MQYLAITKMIQPVVECSFDGSESVNRDVNSAMLEEVGHRMTCSAHQSFLSVKADIAATQELRRQQRQQRQHMEDTKARLERNVHRRLLYTDVEGSEALGT